MLLEGLLLSKGGSSRRGGNLPVASELTDGSALDGDAVVFFLFVAVEVFLVVVSSDSSLLGCFDRALVVLV